MLKKILTSVMALAMLASIGIVGASARSFIIEKNLYQDFEDTLIGNQSELHYVVSYSLGGGYADIKNTDSVDRYASVSYYLYRKNGNNYIMTDSSNSASSGTTIAPGSYKMTDLIFASNTEKVFINGGIYALPSMSSTSKLDSYEITCFLQ